MIRLSLVLSVLFFALQVSAETSITTINDYNERLPFWGVSWSPGANAINGYYPSFYTGFAMRSQFGERIHVRTSRGNQTRVSVILDDVTIRDYLFDLVKRESFYIAATSNGRFNIKPSSAKLTPQLEYFSAILNSTEYGIKSVVQSASNRKPEDIYTKSLEVLSKLNPGRVFMLEIDLDRERLRWQTEMKDAGGRAKVMKDPQSVILALNSLVFGRINFVEKPNADLLARLDQVLALNLESEDSQRARVAYVDLVRAATGTKFNFRILVDGEWALPITCPRDGKCLLRYPEFTAIYPTGSAMSKTKDEFGNSINSFSTPGLWQFLSRPGKHEVDNIRNEPYYGFAPKMDYEVIGNGFHNPAVRFWGPPKELKSALGIPQEQNTLWAVKRGGVSRGCLRFPLGHLWEFRQIFPVENERMTEVMFFGNRSQDFDVYDVDGDGQPEVMGVQYMISYGLQGTSGLATREGQGMEVNQGRKLEFYEDLYGARNVFKMEGGGRFVFEDPMISHPSYLDLRKQTVTVRQRIRGKIPLYEQIYEREKVQFYSLVGGMTPANKALVRLLGRARGCAPDADKKVCGESAFDQESRALLR